MTIRSLLALAAVLATLYAPTISAGDAPKVAVAAKKAGGAEAIPQFDKAYLSDAKNIAAGEAVWVGQCRHCHGAKAYPGKAPKLKPARLEPEFIFDRVTNGFRKMPGWKSVFTLEQRKSVVAYIKSEDFSP